jgi:hypothetical protein
VIIVSSVMVNAEERSFAYSRAITFPDFLPSFPYSDRTALSLLIKAATINVSEK